MKIGVITFCFSKDNYGQILQCYALQTFLKKQGHDAFLINYQPDFKNGKSGFKLQRIFYYILNFKKYLKWWFNQKRECRSKSQYELNNKNNERRFDEFIKKYIKITSSLYNMDKLNENPPLADAYICGSDQIWGNGGDWPFYLSFVPDNKLKIAYAPSMGGINQFSDEIKPILIYYLKRFDFIGMREKSGEETIRQLGIGGVTTVIDPTMLLSDLDYKKLITTKKYQRPYILLYLLGKPCECDAKEVYAFAQENGLEVKYVASGGQYDQYDKKWPTIEEWLELVSSANLVITNSFHCTVFALQFSTPFITVLLNEGYERMNSRVSELLAKCQLSHRIYKGSLDAVYQSEINFDKFQEYRKCESMRSFNLLESFLNKK